MPKRLGPSSIPQTIIGYRKDGRPIRVIAGGSEEPRVQVPDDLKLSTDEELETWLTAKRAEFAVIDDPNRDITPEELTLAGEIANDIDRIKAEQAGRKARAEKHAEAQAAQAAAAAEALRLRVNGPTEDDDSDDGGDTAPAPVVDPEALAASVGREVTHALMTFVSERGNGKAIQRRSLAEARQYAEEEPAATPEPLAVTAAIEGDGVSVGGNVASLEQLADLANRKAKQLTVSRAGDTRGGAMIATVRNRYEHSIDDRTPLHQVDELVRWLQNQDGRAESADALVAAGGWCAPPEQRYDFFNIACSNGMIDLPTFGVTRGGISFPVSPSMADLFSGDGGLAGFAQEVSVTTNPWLWTEASDIAAVTGSPEKPCVRVPCPDFDTATLEGIGICLTAGNLTDDAYPEATRNTLQLLMRGHDHAVNGRIISTMVGLSEAAIDTGSFAATGGPVFNQVYGGLSLAAVDYRARYGMCEDDTLEAVAPYWLKSVIKADLAHRTGVDPEIVTDAQLQSWFSAINVRVQWVDDWQVRGASQFGNATAMTSWPASATVMLYAAGTFLRGNGLSLDLGVVRDSVLNATNDHTAAWSEEFFLVAKVGHESRQYTLNFSVNGRTGAADIVGHNL